METRDVVRALHDLQNPSAEFLHPRDQLSGIPPVRPDLLEARELADQFRQNELGSVSILNARGVDHDREDQAQGIDDEMALTTGYLLARIKAARPPFSVVFTDWLSTTAALGLASFPTD